MNKLYYATPESGWDKDEEIRRLRESNSELLSALKGLLLFPNNPRENYRAREIIAKATQETK